MKHLKITSRITTIVPLILSFFIMSYTATNCSKNLADKECSSCIKEDIQGLLNDGRCNEAREKAGTNYPELRAMANLCLGAPPLTCLLNATTVSSRNSTNFLVEASSCASGSSGNLLAALDSNRLSDSNQLLALMYLFLEAIRDAGAGCTDNSAGGCTLGTNFTDTRLNDLNTLSKKGIGTDSMATALKKCSNDYCSTLTEYLLTL